MDAFSRTITIHCPDCGGTGFELLDCSSQEEITTAPYDSRLQCLGCQRVFTKGELIQCQQEAIDLAAQSIKEEMDEAEYSAVGEDLKRLNDKLIDIASILDGYVDPSEASDNRFHGKLMRLKLISNSEHYGLMPGPDEEVEQHITINRNGRVWFSSYCYGEQSGKYERRQIRQFTIDKKEAAGLLDLVATYFEAPFQEDLVTDIGDWNLWLYNSDNEVFQYRSSLSSRLILGDVDLSDSLRTKVGIRNLLAFDGC